MLAITLCACNNEKREVERISLGYLDAMGNYRLDEAKPFATQRTVDVTLDFYRRLMPMIDSAYLAANTPAVVSIRKVQMLTDTTAIALFHKSTPASSVDDTLHLLKEDGQWLVHEVIVIPPMFVTDTAVARQRRIKLEEAKKMQQGAKGSL